MNNTFYQNGNITGLNNTLNNMFNEYKGLANYNLNDLNNIYNTDNLNVPSGNWFQRNTDTLSAIGTGLEGLSGLANAYMGYKNFNLAKDMFNYQKALANRNLANQAKIINNTYDNAAQVAAGMIGSKDSYGNYGFTNQDIVNKYANAAKDKHVSGSI